MSNIIANQADIATFALAGKATFTLRSTATDNRFTYKVRLAKDERIHFVSTFSDAEREHGYTYIGVIRSPVGNGEFSHGRKSPVPADAPSVRAFEWFWKRLTARAPTPGLEFWHEGKCGRCGRKLTVPESIANGIGPECQKKARARRSGFKAEAPAAVAEQPARAPYGRGRDLILD